MNKHKYDEQWWILPDMKYPLSLENRIRTTYLCRWNKVFTSKLGFAEYDDTPEKGWRINSHNIMGIATHKLSILI